MAHHTEKHSRSVIKGIIWRCIATLDTIFLSWLFTGNVESALKIGGIEVFTKIFLYYLHERAWLKIPLGQKTIQLASGLIITQDLHYRSALKGASYRFWGTLDTMLIAFFITGNYAQALKIGVTEVVTKLCLFYLHERIWNKIPFGLKPDIRLDDARNI